MCCVQQHFYYYCYFIESVCVHFNLRFNSNVPIAQNFIYIARLGIVIEQKIVLTFRIIFTMWNSFTEWKL